VKDMRVIGRATQGVTMINLAEGDLVTSVTRIEDADDDTSSESSEEETTSAPEGGE
jgi:DNA gyrase subunit A